MKLAGIAPRRSLPLRIRLAPGPALAFALAATPAGCDLSAVAWEPRRVPQDMPAQLVATGRWHSCVLYRNRNLGCWGENGSGQLGVPGSEALPRPLGVLLSADPVGVAAGAHHSCAALTDGAVQCWGTNHEGFLGVAAPDCATDPAACRVAPSVVPSVTGAVAVAASGEFARSAADAVGFSCAIQAADVVLCWGDNRHGQLGRGSSEPFHGNAARVVNGESFALRQVVKVAAGNTHACAVDATGAVSCWGNMWTENIASASERVAAERLPGTSGAVDVAAGESHACAALSSGQVACWGENRNGQAIPSGGDYISAPMPVPGLGRVTAVAAGGRHTCVLVDGGSVVCWGSNEEGQIGHSTQSLELLPNLVALPGPAVQISAGFAHTCAVMDDGAVYCWGSSRLERPS
jgi:alpha-tubulin suppressor-like RCC1 family protein